MTPVAVAEIDASRLDAGRSDFPGIAPSPPCPEMLKKSASTCVTIITPHNTHAPLALQCLKAGRHVVCEKPFAITTAECDAMIAAARRSKRGALHLPQPPLGRLHHGRGRAASRAGAIGEVVRVEAHMGAWGKPGDWWRTSKTISGGILYDWGVHLLEYSLQIIDSKIAEVTRLRQAGASGRDRRAGRRTPTRTRASPWCASSGDSG